MFKHTDETDARIRKGYEAKERVLDIANSLGLSRNAVIGRANRMGLCEDGRQFKAFNPHSFDDTPEGRERASAAAKAVHSDPQKHSRIMLALRHGAEIYHANRKANHSANRSTEPAQ